MTVWGRVLWRSDHSGVVGATAAEATLPSANFALGTLSKTQTTARASGRSGQRYGRRSPTSPGLEASTSRSTSGRQPASELPYP